MAGFLFLLSSKYNENPKLAIINTCFAVFLSMYKDNVIISSRAFCLKTASLIVDLKNLCKMSVSETGIEPVTDG